MAKLPSPSGRGAGGEGEFKIPEGTDPNSPFVAILDPATGTATFLVEVIDIIYKTLSAKWRKQGMTDKQQAAAWNEYVPKHLLPRLYGYELMMAPYAIAHMKIGLKLHETGYRFGSEERARICLTNALEPASDDKKQMEIEQWAPALAHEVQAVNAVKRGQRFTVVMGNPPYSGHSDNNGEWIAGLLRTRLIQSAGYFEVNGAPLGERKPKWLNDDYVKFICLAQVTIEQAQTGVLGFITNHGYLDNPTFRGMRQSLTQTFNQCYLFDLHGNSKKKEKAEDGSKDENVFDIQQGVAIGLFLHAPLIQRGSVARGIVTVQPPPLFPGNAAILVAISAGGTPALPREGERLRGISHTGLYGMRANKYQKLTAEGFRNTDWKTLQPQAPFYLFSPQDENLRDEYEHGWKITDIMPVNVLGFQTHRDDFAIAFDKDKLLERIAVMRGTEQTDSDFSQRYALKDNRDWKISVARSQLRNDNYWKEKFMYWYWQTRNCRSRGYLVIVNLFSFTCGCKYFQAWRS